MPLLHRRSSVALAFTLLVACSSSEKAPDHGGPELRPGEVCDPEGSADLKLRFDPPLVVVGDGATRPARLIAEPDLCEPMEATFTVDDASIVDAPKTAPLDLRHATADLAIVGKQRGKAKITVTVVRPADRQKATATLDVEVRAPEAPRCAAPAHGTPLPDPQPLDATHGTVSGTSDLATASVAVPAAAFARSDFWGFPPFAASVDCDENDLTREAPGGLVALGPAVSFTASGPVSGYGTLRREVELAIPVNPAAMPTAARLRHVQVLYRSPRAKIARTVPVRDARFERDGGSGWVLKFSAPFFGTFQAAVAPNAGTVQRKRHLTHRAVFGFSMGGGGAASVGLRHHDRFDVIGALGGPSDFTWLLHYVDDYLLGGFCPVSQPNCTKYGPSQYPNDEPFVHTGDFNHFWYETGSGNGGDFSRESYGNLFTDLSIMLGAPNGQSGDVPYLALGLKRSDPFVSGNVTDLPPNTDCIFSVNPSSTDDPTLYASVQDKCRAARCDPKNTWIAKTGYYDDEYNPDGSRQVISFCDGTQNGQSPYVDSWAANGTGNLSPLNFALAVDLNKNGVRDENEPVIRGSGHEPFDDVGEDGLPDAKEPGFDPLTNPDPNQDDYDPQINPTGTEKNFHYDQGEPFHDDGLDGVPNTKSLHVAGDPGEGDGVFTETEARKNFRAVDGKALLRRWVDPPAGPLDDDALLRLDILSDGGIRDLFNFGAVARHFQGGIVARKRADGTPLRAATFYSAFDVLPGQKKGASFSPADMLWDDVPAMPSIQYGNVDASPADIENGDGMHVGTTNQLLARVQMAFFAIGRAWTDADRTRTETTDGAPATTTKNALGIDCELKGRCETTFTGPKSGRTGPIAVTLPPGYAHEAHQSQTYPVIYVMHGYGMDPRDLMALGIVTNGFMNDGTRSYVTRLPKAIVVYLDGRCRVGKDGAPECIRGNFYLNSTRDGGPKNEDWILEVMDYIDQNYRTMAPSDVDVTE